MLLMMMIKGIRKSTYFVARTLEYGQTALQFNIQIFRIQMVHNVRYHIFRDESNLKVFLCIQIVDPDISPKNEGKCL